MIREKLAPLLLSSVILCSCVGMPGEQAAVNHYVETQKNLATALQSEGELARALSVWRSLLPLGRADDQIVREIESLEALIATNVASNLDAGRQAYKQGNSRRGDYYMLRALSLQPGQDQARQALARSFSARARARQTSPDSSAKPIVEKTPKIEPGSLQEGS